MNDPTPASAPRFVAWVGIDWADEKHAVTLKVIGSTTSERRELDNTPEAVEAWAAGLALRFAGRPVAVALEQSRGPLVCMLSKYAHLVLFPVHPTSLADYRKTWRPSGAKDDPQDGDLLLDLLERHGERLRALRPDTVETRTLQFLTEERRKLVEDRTRYAHRLSAQLKLYYPQILQWFENLTSPLVLDFLQRWPHLAVVQKGKPATLRRFFCQHHCRDQGKMDERLAAIAQAVEATQDAAVLRAGCAAVAVLVRLLRDLQEAIADYDRQIDALAHAHPDYALFDSFPGAGAALVPRLIAALGTQRDRFASAQEIQCCSGIAPVIESSGHQHWVHWRWACSKFLRQTFHEWAQHSIGFSDWARAFYEHQRARNKGHHAAVRALAFKWIRILFRCWQDHKPYDETVYLHALAAHQSISTRAKSPKLIGRVKKPVFTWTSCTGFNKLVGLDY